MARLTADQRKRIPPSKFAGGKSKANPTGRFPLNDKTHIRAARSLERYATPAEKQKIDAAAKREGIGKPAAKSKGKK